MHVYVLEATVSAPDNENTMEWQDGITSVHATQQGAIDRLGRWLDSNGIDRESANYSHGTTSTDTFIGSNPDPDLLDGAELNWGINLMEVHP